MNYEEKQEKKIRRKINLFNKSLPQNKQSEYVQMLYGMTQNSEEYIFPLNKFQLREYKFLCKILSEYMNYLDMMAWEYDQEAKNI